MPSVRDTPLHQEAQITGTPENDLSLHMVFRGREHVPTAMRPAVSTMKSSLYPYSAPACKSVAQLPGSMYATPDTSPGPTKRRCLMVNHAVSFMRPARLDILSRVLTWKGRAASLCIPSSASCHNASDEGVDEKVDKTFVCLIGYIGYACINQDGCKSRRCRWVYVRGWRGISIYGPVVSLSNLSDPAQHGPRQEKKA